MIQVIFPPAGTVADAEIKFAVIAARYADRWVFCRHKARNTWEIPGGHREPGERIEDTAARELREETGALEADIRPIGIYGVDRDGSVTYGMLFFAKIALLGPLPEEMEIGSIRLFDRLPGHLTYPEIQPSLYHAVQGWLNLQSSADELWDVYDSDRRPQGRLHRRGDPMPAGDYHLGVHVWLQNSKGEFLITKRSPNKGFPNLWECTGGSAVAGDDSLTAAIREVREETGLELSPENGRMVMTYVGADCFSDIWLFRMEIDTAKIVLQEGETCDFMLASRDIIYAMREEGTFIPFSWLDEFMDRI